MLNVYTRKYRVGENRDLLLHLVIEILDSVVQFFVLKPHICNKYKIVIIRA